MSWPDLPRLDRTTFGVHSPPDPNAARTLIVDTAPSDPSVPGSFSGYFDLGPQGRHPVQGQVKAGEAAGYTITFTESLKS